MEQYHDTLEFQNQSIPNPYIHETLKAIKPELEREIFIHRVKTKEDYLKAFHLRRAGFKRDFTMKTEVIDILDFSPNCTLLLAKDDHQNSIGTLSIIDRKFGKLELDDFIDVDSMLSENENSCIQVNWLSVPSHENEKRIEQLLWKATLLYCLITKVKVIFYSARVI